MNPPSRTRLLPLHHGRLVARKEHCGGGNFLGPAVARLLSDHQVVESPGLEAEGILEILLVTLDQVVSMKSGQQCIRADSVEAKFG